MFHLKEISDTYKDELLEPGYGKAARKAHFSNLEAILARFMSEMDLARAQRAQGPQVATVPSRAGRVAALVAFHEGQQQSSTREDQKAAMIIKARIWLHRQGAVLTREGKIVWRKSKARVAYDRELQQVLTMARIRGGRFYGIDGQPLDTAGMVTSFSGPGWAIFVVSAEGTLHVSPHQVGKRHHSSLLAAAPVACAGELICSKGRLVRISNKSGHYKPEPYYLAQVIRHFGQEGVNLDSFSVVTTDEDGKTEYPSGRVFLDGMRIPFLPTPVSRAGPNSYAMAGSAMQGGIGGRPGGAYAGDAYELEPNPRHVEPPSLRKAKYEYHIPGFE